MDGASKKGRQCERKAEEDETRCIKAGWGEAYARRERDIQALTTPGLATVVQKIDFVHGRSEEIEGRGQAQGKKDVWETVGDVLDILEGVRRVCPYLVFSASERIGRN